MPCVHQPKASSIEPYHLIIACLYGVNISAAREMHKDQYYMFRKKRSANGRRQRRRTRRHAKICVGNEGQFLTICKSLAGFCRKECINGCVCRKGKCIVINGKHTEIANGKRGYGNGYCSQANCLMIDKKHIMYNVIFGNESVGTIMKQCDPSRRRCVDDELLNNIKGLWGMIKKTHFSSSCKEVQSTDGEDMCGEGAWESDATSGFTSRSRVSLSALLGNESDCHAMVNSMLDDGNACPTTNSLSHAQEESSPMQEDVPEINEETHEDSRERAVSHADISCNVEGAIANQLNMTEKRRRPGEVIDKGHRSYDLMLNLQLGIRFFFSIFFFLFL
jgi:hypothetical protein